MEQSDQLREYLPVLMLGVLAVALFLFGYGMFRRLKPSFGSNL